MTVKSSGPISISDIVTEFGVNGNKKLSNYYRGGTLVSLNCDPKVPQAGRIDLSDFYGVSNVVPGNAIFTTVGNTNFIIPKFNRLIVECWGGGGGNYNNGSLDGGTSSVFGVGATGGSALQDIGGYGYGGDVSYTGGLALNGNQGGGGGAAGRNGNGGIATPTGGLGNGTYSGNGGIASVQGPGGNYGGGAGALYRGGCGGGYAKKTFTPGQLTVGSTAIVTVGAGGYSSIGGSGGQGLVLITWD